MQTGRAYNEMKLLVFFACIILGAWILAVFISIFALFGMDIYFLRFLIYILIPMIVLSLAAIFYTKCPICGCRIFLSLYIKDLEIDSKFEKHLSVTLLQILVGKAVCPCCNKRLK